MTEQNIRDAFEREPEYQSLDKKTYIDSSTGRYVYYVDLKTCHAFRIFRSGWIAAFKVILESENE